MRMCIVRVAMNSQILVGINGQEFREVDGKEAYRDALAHRLKRTQGCRPVLTLSGNATSYCQHPVKAKHEHALKGHKAVRTASLESSLPHRHGCEGR